MKKSKSLLLFAVLIGCVLISCATENITPMPPLSVPGQIPVSSPQETITPEDAAKFIGESKTVCGLVVQVHYETRLKRQPTILNLNKPYPKQVFTVLIWGSDRSKFDKPPETLYAGKKICVMGMIQSYQGGPGIIVKDPLQIKFMK